MINLVTKQYFYKVLGIPEDSIRTWVKIPGVILETDNSKIGRIPENLCYFIYEKGNIPFVYFEFLNLILIPKFLKIPEEQVKSLINSKISLNPWSLTIIEEKNSNFSYTKNSFKINCSREYLLFNDQSNFAPGVYEIKNNTTKEAFIIEIYEENYYWKSYYISFPGKENIKYPIPKEIIYKDALFKLIITYIINGRNSD